MKAAIPTEPISIAEEALAAFAGLYYNPESEIGASYKIMVRNGKLVIDLGPGFDLAPLADDLFYIAAFDVIKMNFRKTSNGKKQMVLLVEGLEIVYDEVDAVEPKDAELGMFAGNYFSDELDTIYPISLRDEKLSVQLKKHGEFPLQPTFQNGFSLDLSQLVGTPYTMNIIFFGDDNKIEGLHMSSGRAKRILFTRQ